MHKEVSRIGIIFCMLLAVICLVSVTVSAHSPSDLSLSYDKVSGVLTVSVDHDSSDITIHNIARIEITVNEQFQEIAAYDWDENDDGLIATYNITINDDDKVIVEAFCSEFGSISNSLLVGDTGTVEGTPGFEVLLVVAALLIFMVIRKRGISKT